MTSPPELLGRVPLFSELGPGDLRWLAGATKVHTFSEGEHIFEIGEPGRSLYIVTAGTVQVLHPNQPSTVQLARVGPGEFIGEMALLDDAPRSATALALCEVEALVLDKTELHRLLLERSDVALRLLEVLSRRIRKADEHISGLSARAVRDPLTGLHNRLAFDERLEEESARTRRYGSTFSLLLVDLAGFTAVNETHGGEVGDRILVWVGRLLNEHTRASDVPFRLEKDLFALLCPRTSAGVAGNVVSRLAALVAEAKPPVEAEMSLSLTGVFATCPDDAREAHALYHQAQRALLVAKAAIR